jgi:hypothetical protein
MHVLCPPLLLIANNKDPDENLLQQLPLRHSSGTFFVSIPKYSSRIGPAHSVSNGLRNQSTDSRILRNGLVRCVNCTLGYGFRIYGIEMDMYRISRGVIFVVVGNRRFDTYGFHADSRIPCGFRQKRSATPPRRGPPPPRAQGMI